MISRLTVNDEKTTCCLPYERIAASTIRYRMIATCTTCNTDFTHTSCCCLLCMMMYSICSCCLYRREVVDEFMKIIGSLKKCENCGAFSPALRKDGYSKLFQKPLNEKALKHNEVCSKSNVHHAPLRVCCV
jgi:hypothetical protein